MISELQYDFKQSSYIKATRKFQPLVNLILHKITSRALKFRPRIDFRFYYCVRWTRYPEISFTVTPAILGPAIKQIYERYDAVVLRG